MKYFLSILVLTIGASAGIFDQWHEKLQDFFGNSLEKLDKFLSESNETVSQKYSLETSIRAFAESRNGDHGFKFNINAKVSLPRTQRKLYLFLQDFKKTGSIDEKSGNSLANSISNSSYLFGAVLKTATKLKFTAGLRFHTITPDPYIGAQYNDTIKLNPKSWIDYGDRLRFFVDNKLDNLLFCNYDHILNSDTTFAFENSLRYLQEPSKESQLLNALKLYVTLGSDRYLIPRAEIYSTINVDRSHHIDYYYAGIDYHDTIWRKWLFYEVSPAVVWRETNHFNESYRISFTVGVRFSKP